MLLFRVGLDAEDSRDLLDPREKMVHLAHRENQENVDLQENMGVLDPQEILDLMVTLVTLERRGILVVVE